MYILITKRFYVQESRDPSSNDKQANKWTKNMTYQLRYQRYGTADRQRERATM